MRFRTTADNISLLQVSIALTVILFALVLTSCTKAEESDETTINTRWMDRTIYFADPNLSDPFRNNFFQKEKVKAALTEIATGTSLGPNYFNFVQVPESELEPIIEAADDIEFKSFVLIWPDNVFNAYVEAKLGSNLPDQNAITVVNAANKKQFYIILRASCAEVTTSCMNVTDKGFKALIARQLGLLVGLQTNCTNSQNIMCATPSDLQWSEVNQFNFFNSFNNQLEQILNTPGFYN